LLIRRDSSVFKATPSACGTVGRLSEAIAGPSSIAVEFGPKESPAA
jgi:hypothetical protein